MLKSCQFSAFRCIKTCKRESDSREVSYSCLSKGFPTATEVFERGGERQDSGGDDQFRQLLYCVSITIALNDRIQ